MYPSGTWRGFWVQEHLGRQPMADFVLRFRRGKVTGQGADVIGRFTFAGECDERTGRLTLVKQYVGKHRVEYAGGPDGEGSIGGTWTTRTRVWGHEYVATGPFLMQPDLPKPTADEPIREIG